MSAKHRAAGARWVVGGVAVSASFGLVVLLDVTNPPYPTAVSGQTGDGTGTDPQGGVPGSGGTGVTGGTGAPGDPAAGGGGTSGSGDGTTTDGTGTTTDGSGTDTDKSERKVFSPKN